MSATRTILLASCAAVLALFSACSGQPEQTGGADRYIHLATGPDIAQRCRVKTPHFQLDEADGEP